MYPEKEKKSLTIFLLEIKNVQNNNNLKCRKLKKLNCKKLKDYIEKSVKDWIKIDD